MTYPNDSNFLSVVIDGVEDSVVTHAETVFFSAAEFFRPSGPGIIFQG
jgi:hypothetical protein